MRIVIRDRDYFKDIYGNIMRVIGDFHSDNGIIALVKYYPKPDGSRTIVGEQYGYNTFLNNSLSIMKDKPNRIVFSDDFGVSLCFTPIELIKDYYSCREKTIEILNNKNKYTNHCVGNHLVSFLEKIAGLVDINCIGVTGSFLFDAFNDLSDIDLVCYGNETYDVLVDVFDRCDYIQRYEGDLEESIYKRRMNHMQFVDMETLMIQESRKLQGRIIGTSIHINFTPLRDDNHVFKDFSMVSNGVIQCVVQISDDCNGRFSPSIYSINLKTIISSTLSDLDILKRLNILISYNGDYSQVFRNRDYTYVEGRIVKINYLQKTLWGIDITPWDIGSKNRAVLMRMED